MRVSRLVAVALWVTVAMLAVAGFAAFSPEPTAEPATTSTSITLPTRGDTSGQVLARAAAGAFSEPTTVAVEAPPGDPVVADMLGDRRLDPPTTTTLPAIDTSRQLTRDEVRSLISLFFKPRDVETALKIAWCESTFDPNATNKQTKAAGLFQHLPRYWAERSAKAGWEGADIYDPYANVAVAAWLRYHAGGWSHWTCWNG